jgi:hypothetical protein
MALKKIIDDTLITTDTEGNRMYLDISDGLRLRSSDPYNVVLEQYRKVDSKDGSSRMDWMFEGYYPTHLHIFAQAKAHTDAHRLHGRKFNRPTAAEYMIGKYFNIWQHVSTAELKEENVVRFIKEAKEHEFKKLQENSQKGAESRARNKKKDG